MLEMVTEPTALASIAVDVVKGTVIEKLVEPAISPLWDVLKPIFLPWWDSALHEIRLRLQEAAEELRQRDASVIDALGRSLQRGEADALTAGFLRAAAQATTESRMKMLAAAAAGVLTPDLDSEMRSRVSRAVMQLEPSDVLELRKLVPGIDHAVAEAGRPRGRSPEREPLFLAGCLWEDEGIGGKLRISALGHAILEALEAWSPSSP